MVNLVDTPGHVDFSGKVTRSMRSIDGAVVVIDAVEGIMAQTESVLHSAIKERVKPILFINKIDRLIRELKLTSKEIQTKLAQIIKQTNTLISEATKTENSLCWEISVSQGNVAFGSALHKWGFTAQQLKEKALQFQDVINFYKADKVEDLAALLPIHKPILKMILEQLPSPKAAQEYRIHHIWKGDTTSPAGNSLRLCDSNGPLIIGIIRVVTNSRYGHIAVGRVFSGTVKRGTMIRIYPQELPSKIQRLSLFMGSRRIVVPAITAGNICGVTGQMDIKAGDTLTGLTVPSGMVPFEEITYLSEPVVTIAIEPSRPRELPRLLSILDDLTKKDPNLVFLVNEKTGENLLSGLGLLHLELALNDMQKAGIQVEASDPIVLYRETLKNSVTFPNLQYSPNGKNGILISVLNWENKTDSNKELVWFDDERNNVLTFLAPSNISETEKESLIAGFIWAMERGPLCGEPLGSTIVQIHKLELSDQPPEKGRVELMSMIKDAIFQAFKESGMTLLEPIYQIQVLVPTNLLSEITNIIMAKRGKISQIDHKGLIASINGTLPVSETFDLANVIRSKTSGRATWQTSFALWERVPNGRTKVIADQIKKRKGWQ